MTHPLRRTAYRSLIVLVAIFALAQGRSSFAEEPSFGWVPIATGIEYSLAPKIAAGRVKGDMLVVRIDPASALFRVYYEPGKRRTIQQWAALKPGAVVMVNASFFRGNGRPSGLLRIGNELLSAASGRPDSAQFRVVDDVPSISPIALNEPIPAAGLPGPYIESFEGHPLLIRNGQATPDSMTGDDLNRRTVIAQDNQGHILIINTETVLTSLPDLTMWLLNSNLGIVTALNLDGGPSSQIYVGADKLAAGMKRGRIAVPVVLAVFPR